MARQPAPPRRTRGRLYLRIAGWFAVLVVLVLVLRKIQHFVTADHQFALALEGKEALRIEGAVHASRVRILRVFALDEGRSVFLVPLAERRRRLLGIDWVEDASVSRIWPNRLVVRIRERKPVAFANVPLTGLSGSRVFLVDAEGVLLEVPAQSRFTFPVLSGIADDQNEAERRERVRAMMRLLDNLGPLAKEISEVDVSAPDDLRMIAQVDGRALQIELGEGNYARRFQNFLRNYPEIRKRSGEVSSFDLRLEDRITAKE